MNLRTVFYTCWGAPMLAFATFSIVHTVTAKRPMPPAGRHGPAPAEAGVEHPPRSHPVLKLLDANDDRMLSPTEIDAASAALRGFDSSGDGWLNEDELVQGLPPPHPPPAPRADRLPPPSHPAETELPYDGLGE